MKNRWMTFPFLIIMIVIQSCGNSSNPNYLSEEKQAEYINKGKQIIQQSFQALSRELHGALSTGGAQHAVGYCHLKASPIIDSLSTLNQVKISRTATKLRNPVNTPSNLDITVMDAYQKQLEEGRPLQPHLEVEGQVVIFYAPIVIQNPMCLICHGDPGVTMDQANYDFIKSRYPADQATGYKLNDLRGVWKVEFNQSSI
jgi:hypothetical protein